MAPTFCPTLCCDHRCVICPNELTSWSDGAHCLRQQRALDELGPDEAYITISGGEPTLYPQRFLALLSQLTEKCPQADLQVLSHGGRFSDPQFVATAAQYSRRIHLEIPVHGPDSSLHDYIAGKRGSFTNARRAIRHLLQMGIPVDVRVVVNRLNYGHLPQIVGYVTSSLPGVRSIIFISMEATGACRLHLDTLWIRHRALQPYLKEAVYGALLAQLEVRLYNYGLCLLESDLWPLASDSISPHKKCFPPICSRCLVQDHCPGIFVSNQDVIYDELKPVT